MVGKPHGKWQLHKRDYRRIKLGLNLEKQWESGTGEMLSGDCPMVSFSINNRQTCFLLLCWTLWITTGKDWLAVACRKLLLCAKETRHQEVKQWPQLQHIILYWSARQNETVICDQLLDCFWRLQQKHKLQTGDNWVYIQLSFSSIIYYTKWGTSDKFSQSSFT